MRVCVGLLAHVLVVVVRTAAAAPAQVPLGESLEDVHVVKKRPLHGRFLQITGEHRQAETGAGNDNSTYGSPQTFIQIDSTRSTRRRLKRRHVTEDKVQLAFMAPKPASAIVPLL